MTFKKIIGTLHLWLGLFSGLVVFVVAVTGCIYVFQKEIQDLTQPYRFVEPMKQSGFPSHKTAVLSNHVGCISDFGILYFYK